MSRERAYVYDLHITPLWREVFDRLYCKHAKLPTFGSVLEINCGTGGLALEIAASLGERGKVLALEADDALIELARTKASITNLKNVTFGHVSLLDGIAELYDLIIVDLSLSEATDVAAVTKLLRSGGTLVVKYLGRGSFDEVYSVLWEALFEQGVAAEYQSKLEQLIHRYRSCEQMAEYLRSLGLKSVRNYRHKEEFTFSDAKEFLDSPLMQQFMDDWMAVVKPGLRQRLSKNLRSVID